LEIENQQSAAPNTTGFSTNRELLSYLIEDDGKRIKSLFSDEAKIEKRLKNALMIPRKVISGTRVTGIIGHRSLVVAGSNGNVEYYNIQSSDLVPMKSLSSMTPAHQKPSCIRCS
jgi:hypothetical protein